MFFGALTLIKFTCFPIIFDQVEKIVVTTKKRENQLKL